MSAELQQANQVVIRLLRVFVAWLLPPPILVAVFILITDLFYFNRTDPEYIGILDSWEYGDFWFIYIFECVVAYFLLAIPLLVYSLVLEFGCRQRISRYCLTGAVGIAIGGSIASIMTSAFTLHSTWNLLEACAQCFGSFAVMMLVVIAIDFRVDRDQWNY